MAVLGAGGTNPPLIPDALLTVSTTWSPPYKIKALVRCFGGGGSGAIGRNESSLSKGMLVTGGGAGEHAGSILELDPSVTYTVVVGAGGAGRASTYDGIQAGNAGGNTSFAGSGITTITANGGAGGLALNAPDAGTAYTQAGAAGGSGGAGELYRHTGGAGGAITKPSGSNNVLDNTFVTGGGAVGLFGTGHAGGLVSWVTTASNSRNVGTGGGGVNGAGGPVNSDSGYTTHLTWGGSSFGPAGNTTVATTQPGWGTNSDANSAAPNADAWESTFDFWQSGSLLDRVNHTFPQAYGILSPPGTGGMGRNNVAAYSWGSGATLFGGGGAICTSNIAFNIQSQNYNFWQQIGGRLGGGGGGGGISSNTGSKLVNSGIGGRGGVLIEMLERVT